MQIALPQEIVLFPCITLRHNSSPATFLQGRRQFALPPLSSLPLSDLAHSAGAKAALLLSKDLPASPPGLHGCACSPFLLSTGSTQIRASSWQELIPVCIGLHHWRSACSSQALRLPQVSWETGRVQAQPHPMEKPCAVVSRLDIKLAAESQREVGSTRQAVKLKGKGVCNFC